MGSGAHARNFLNSLFSPIINGWTEAYQDFRSYYCSKFRRRPPICSYNGLILFLSLIFPCRTQYHRTSLHPMTHFTFSPNLQLHIQRPIFNILFKPRGRVIISCRLTREYKPLLNLATRSKYMALIFLYR